MLHYLRIAVTALSLTACAILIALWVRSYSLRDYFWAAHRNWGLLGITSMYGGILFQINIGAMNLGPNPDNLGVYSEPNVVWLPWWEIVAGPSLLGFRLKEIPRAFIVPHWFFAALALVLASGPWFKLRYTLRALLSATTLVATALGVVIYVAK
jgi:hypothetical protein